MGLKYYMVDAFTDRLFGGNQAGVCLLDAPLSESLMQKIASENNLSETAYVLANESGRYDIRWFTPKVEIDLCGHATLASAFVLHRFIAPAQSEFIFNSRSGILKVRAAEGGLYILDFPARMPQPVARTSEMKQAVGCEILEAHLARDLVLVLESEEAVQGCAPDIARIAALPGHACCVTAKGEACDFVSRFFAPKFGIEEDPVTGSVHCELIPFWAKKLGKSTLLARQLSPRGGTLFCENKGGRVLIGGHAALYLTGEINV